MYKLKFMALLMFLMAWTSGCNTETHSTNKQETNYKETTAQTDVKLSEKQKKENAKLPEKQKKENANLSEKQKKEINALTIAILNAQSGGMGSLFLDKPILSNSDIKDQLYSQWFFLWCLNNDKFTQTNIDMLRPAVQSIDGHSMKLTFKQAEDLLRMAGAEPAPGLEDYLKDSRLADDNQEGVLEFEPYHPGGEVIWDYQIEDMSTQPDGCLIVSGVGFLNPGYGEQLKFELTLAPKPDSIFGGYSAEHIWCSLPDYPGMKVVGKEQILPKKYLTPSSESEDPFEYIFKLDGRLYQMPFPAKELINGGWKIEENGKLDPGGRALIHASENGEKISIAIWNYNTVKSSYEDCEVVWLKTSADNHWARVDFQLMEGMVRNGMAESELKSPVTRYSYSSIPATYGVEDPLYNRSYGYVVYPENQKVVGFEVGYAPNPHDRRQRLDLLTGRGWENDPVMSPPYGTDIVVQLNRIYKVDIDGDGQPEDIDFRFLDGVGIANNGILCVIVDGQAVASVEGATDVLSDDIYIHMTLQNKTAIVTVDGNEQSNDIHKEFLLKKGWSKVLASTVNGEPDQS